MNIRKEQIFKVYKFICEKYFFITYSMVILSLIDFIITGRNEVMFIFEIDLLNIGQIIFYLVGNGIICLISHKIIQWLCNRGLIIVTVVWIIPLLFFF